jgi:hypothetical protein
MRCLRPRRTDVVNPMKHLPTRVMAEPSSKMCRCPRCAGHGLVRTYASLVSAGTDAWSSLPGNPCGKARRPDLVKQVLARARPSGLVGAGGGIQPTDQPLALGYSSAGTIVDWAGMSGFKIGHKHLLVGACGHAGMRSSRNLLAPSLKRKPESAPLPLAAVGMHASGNAPRVARGADPSAPGFDGSDRRRAGCWSRH